MNPSRYWLDREIYAFAEGLPANSLVLDAGAGDQRYKPMFAAHRYESADFEMADKKYAPSTYVCDLASTPTETDRYDAILFSQVMEHLPDPAAALKELHRVLKPGDGYSVQRRSSTGSTKSLTIFIGTPSSAFDICLSRPDLKHPPFGG